MRIISSHRIVFMFALIAIYFGNFSNAHAEIGQSQHFGVGAIVGDPTGLTAKYWTGPRTALDFTAAWHFSDDEDRFQFHSDYLYHIPTHIQGLQGSLPFYLGLGGRVLTGHDSKAGLRIPFGVSYLPTFAPLEIFAEIVPIMDFAPDTEGALNGGVGVRYYF